MIAISFLEASEQLLMCHVAPFILKTLYSPRAFRRNRADGHVVQNDQSARSDQPRFQHWNTKNDKGSIFTISRKDLYISLELHRSIPACLI